MSQVSEFATVYHCTVPERALKIFPSLVTLITDVTEEHGKTTRIFKASSVPLV